VPVMYSSIFQIGSFNRKETGLLCELTVRVFINNNHNKRQLRNRETQ